MLKIKKQHIRDWNNNIIDEKIIMKHVQSNCTFIINSNNITKKDLEIINN